MDKSHHRDCGEPDHHDRPEGRCHASRSAALNGEQYDQDKHRQWHDKMFKRRRGELQTFDCGQYRNRGRDHGIADEHRRTDDAQSQQWPASSAQCTLTSAISESVPPSPLLSARSSSRTYFAVTTINSAQRIRERTPSTKTRDTGWPSAA